MGADATAPPRTGLLVLAATPRPTGPIRSAPDLDAESLAPAEPGRRAAVALPSTHGRGGAPTEANGKLELSE